MDHYLASTGWVTAQHFATYARPRTIHKHNVIPRVLTIREPQIKVKDFNYNLLKELRRDFYIRIRQKRIHNEMIEIFWNKHYYKGR